MSLKDDPAKQLADALWSASIGKPVYKPFMVKLTYVLTYGSNRSITVQFPTWVRRPLLYLNIPMVKFALWRYEAAAWWDRLLFFGTPSEHALLCVVIATVASWIIR